MNIPSRMKIGSLFSGYGGLDLAVQSAIGGTLAWVSDIEPGPSRILAHHHPDVPNLGDVTMVDWTQVEPVDIICGGSPCQDLSHAGRRAGMRDGTRSGLWASMCEAIETIRPAYVIWENVLGALSAPADSDMGPCEFGMGCDGQGVPLRALGRVLGDLAEVGYDAAWTTLAAADIGAPHRRGRVFVLAWPATDPNDIGRAWAGATRDRLGGPTDGGRGDVTLLPTPTAVTRDRTDEEIDHRRATRPTQSLNLDEVKASEWGDYAAAIARWEALTRPAPAPTQPSTRTGRPQLSPRFVEWMMGLPGGHVTAVPGLSRPRMLRALGNGVVPAQAAAALRHLLALIDQEAAA